MTFLSNQAQDRSGSATVMMAMASPALVGAAAIAVDLGSLYLAERRLQGIADAAASAALSGSDDAAANAAAERIIAANGARHVSIHSLQSGEYRREDGSRGRGASHGRRDDLVGHA